MAFAAGQTFQERSASFEHMYAPSRAKALFSKHAALKDILDRDLKRMRWEWKTSDTELSKEIKLFHKRSEFLQKKVKDIEDRYFASLTEDEEEDDDGHGETLSRPSTTKSLRRASSDLSHKRARPKTAHASQTPIVEVKERPRSSVSRHSSSNGASRPNSALLSQRSKVQQTVRFEQPPQDIDSTPTHMAARHSAPVRRVSPDFDDKNMSSARKAELKYKRERCKSAFALTKAKKYELRNQRFYDDNERFKDHIQDKIGDYLGRVDKYKEDYKRMLQTERQKPPIVEADVTAIEDISGDSKTANKFQVKLMNPFGMASAFYKQHISEEEASTEKAQTCDSQKPDAKLVETEANHIVAPLTEQNLAKLSLVKSSSSIFSDKPEQTSVNTHQSQNMLRIRQRLASLSGEEMSRERAKLLYHEAHSVGTTSQTATQRNIFREKVRPKELPQQSRLRADKQRMHDMFNEFLDGGRSVEDLQKMSTEVAKIKAKSKKARDTSIIPFMSVRKAAKTWKGLVAHSKAAQAFQSSVPQPD